jgi:hypothetical protein
MPDGALRLVARPAVPTGGVEFRTDDFRISGC